VLAFLIHHTLYRHFPLSFYAALFSAVTALQPDNSAYDGFPITVFRNFY